MKSFKKSTKKVTVKKTPKKSTKKITVKKTPKKITKKVTVKKKITKKPQWKINKKKIKKVITKIVKKKQDIYIEEEYKINLIHPPTEGYNKRIPFPEGFFYPEVNEKRIGLDDVFQKLEEQISNVSDKMRARVAEIFHKSKEERTEEEHFLFTAMMNNDLIEAGRELALRTIPPDTAMILTHKFFSPGMS